MFGNIKTANKTKFNLPLSPAIINKTPMGAAEEVNIPRFNTSEEKRQRRV